jgi:preprotein translocase subunit SecE
MANRLVQYFIDSKAELKKVTWPSKQETAKASLLVIIISLLTAVFLGAVDFALNLGLEKILSI